MSSGADARGGVPALVRTAAIAAAAGMGGLAVALVAGGAAAEQLIPGIATAGTLTRWGLPVSRTIMDLASALTVGALLAAAVLLPLEARRGAGAAGTGTLSRDAIGYLRAASWLAAAWAAAAAATLVFTVSDVLGQPVVQVLTGSELSSYVGSLEQGTALMIVVLLAVVVALLARTTTTPAAAIGLLVMAGVALLPAPLTGHSASSANHAIAVTGVALHVAAVAPWVGGLAVVAAHAMLRRDRLPIMAERFSRMALWCYIVVGASGMMNIVARMPDPVELLTTNYGRLALAKIVAFGVLGWFGWWHRERTVPALHEREARGTKNWAFARLAGVEAAVMAATMGLAVALSSTAPPPPTGTETAVRTLLGYDMPPQVTAGRLATLWWFDLFFAALAVVLAGVYLAGVLRLRRRGDSWPVWRTVFWLVGVATIVLATQTGVARYSPILFSVHMAQHMTLNMLTPIFLVVGAPLTLALRALKPAKIRGDRGPREWLTVMLHSRFSGFVAHPAVATIIFVASTFALYFTPLFQSLMQDHLGHIAMTVHFLLAGFLFFWVLLGVDPAPKRLPYPGRLLLLFVTMPFHAFFGIALMNLSRPIAEGWYNAVDPPWGTTLLQDQHTGGAIAWAFGEIPTFIVLIVLAIQWYSDDQRQARRMDRRADRAARTASATGAPAEDDELAAYNARLAELAERDRLAGERGDT